MRNVIYGMFDPRDGQLRYIGQTTNLEKRSSNHLDAYGLRAKTHKNHWIKSLLALGLTPEFDVLEQFDTPEELGEAEIWNIAYWRSIGANLTNGTDGGEGTTGRKYSTETLAKISASKIGKKPSAETRAKISAANTGREHIGHKCSAETRVRMSAAQTGKKRSAETRAKMSDAHIGKKHSQESRAKMRVAFDKRRDPARQAFLEQLVRQGS